MRSAVFCYAAVDEDSARNLASYLELNCPLLVSLDEGRIDSGDNMLEAAGRALSADHPILLLSPDSVLTIGKRHQWEPVLFDEAHELGRQVAYVLLRPCKFPDLFRRKGFFDLTEHWRTGQRALRRWLLQHDAFLQRATNLQEEPASTGAAKAVFDELESLLDSPGMQAGINRDAALAFARAHTEDFEGVFWLNCAYRSRAGIIGDTAQELGLSLRGPVEESAGRLYEFFASRRLLLIFEHITRSDAAFIAAARGKTSFLFVTEDTPPPPASLETTATLFADWRNRRDACLRALGDAHWHVRNLRTYDGEDRHSTVSLASTAASLLCERGRLAEAYEFLETTKEALRAEGDLFRAARLEWEISWIRDEWGERTSPDTRIILPTQPTQLTLPLTQ
jgi:hypothetical protein